MSDKNGKFVQNTPVVLLSGNVHKMLVVIFGGTGTVGRALIQYLQEVGFPGVKGTPKLVVVGSDKSQCDDVEKNFKVHTMHKDATSMDEVQDVINMHKDEGICAIANVVGDYVRTPAAELTAEDVAALVTKDVTASFNILKGGAECLAATGGGNIACVGAAVVHYGMKHHEAWAATKGAVEAMHRSAAATYAPQNVRVNCVAAGLIQQSPASAEVTEDPEELKKTIMLYPMKRLAQPMDVAHALAFLLHPKTTFTTGVAFPVDGGLTQIAPQGVAGAAAVQEPEGMQA